MLRMTKARPDSVNHTTQSDRYTRQGQTVSATPRNVNDDKGNVRQCQPYHSIWMMTKGKVRLCQPHHTMWMMTKAMSDSVSHTMQCEWWPRQCQTVSAIPFNMNDDKRQCNIVLATPLNVNGDLGKVRLCQPHHSMWRIHKAMSESVSQTTQCEWWPRQCQTLSPTPFNVNDDQGKVRLCQPHHSMWMITKAMSDSVTHTIQYEWWQKAR